MLLSIFRLRGHAFSSRLSPCPRCCSLLSFSVATLRALTLQRANAALFDACGLGPLNASLAASTDSPFVLSDAEMVRLSALRAAPR